MLSYITSTMFLSLIPLIKFQSILGLSYCLGLGKFHCQSYVVILSNQTMSMDFCLLMVEIRSWLLFFSLCKLKKHIARVATPKPIVVGYVDLLGKIII